MNEYLKENLDGPNISIGIVVAEYNSFVTSKLLDATKRTLISYDILSENIPIPQWSLFFPKAVA